MPYKSRIPRTLKLIPPVIDEAIVKGANLVKEDADQRLQPHNLTGELERQTHVEDRRRAGVYVVAGDPKDPYFAFYATFLEHGTRHAPPYPFLVPALEAKREQIVAMVAEAMRHVA